MQKRIKKDYVTMSWFSEEGREGGSITGIKEMKK
jgi:hypothetical protein